MAAGDLSGACEPSVPGRPRLAIAVALVVVALCFSNGHLDPFSLAAMSAAAVAALAAARDDRRAAAGEPVPAPAAGAATSVLGAAIAVSLALDLVLPPGYHAEQARLGWFRPLVALVALVAFSYRSHDAPAWWVRLRFPLLLALSACMTALVIRAAPRPGIDVWWYQQLGAKAFLSGENPYASAYPNIYGKVSPYLEPTRLSGDGTQILAYPYPPLTILVGAASILAGGDVRWALVICVLFSAWAIRKLGRGAREAELAALLLLFQPRAFFVVEQSWTEPTVLAALLLTLLALERWRAREAQAAVPPRFAWVVPGLAAALLAASKQYSPLLLLPLLCAAPARGRWRAAALGLVGAAAVMAPFWAWEPAAFVRGVISWQLVQPFRDDALSWGAALAYVGGPRLPSAVAFVGVLGVLVATLRPAMTAARATTAAAAAFLVFLLLNKQAFCNYYWLAGGILCAAIALRLGDGSGRTADGACAARS